MRNILALGISHQHSVYQCVTLSVGYASQKKCEAKNYMQLINCADAALYRVKHDGRNRTYEYTLKDNPYL